jgi:cellulose synthase/poly-beta-1,6-N-acetylglucosamine synthase-like glycosyltransferase
MKPFFVVLARNAKYVAEKINKLERLGVPYLVICGEQMNHPNVVYREPKGKYDALNLSKYLIPGEAEIVAFNDVDARFVDFHPMLRYMGDPKVGIVFAPELVTAGPQRSFFTLFNPIRRVLPLAASGELMLIRQEILQKILPMKACKAEDTYIMFKTLELGYKVVFSEECPAWTERTKTGTEDEAYKRRTVAGIYQALSSTKPPAIVRFIYALLPLAGFLLVMLGSNGYHWYRGILLGILDYRRGDRSGTWKAT